MKTQNLHTSRVNVGPGISGIDSHASIVSVSKARRLLGSLSDNMTDDQVQELVHTLHLIAREQLCYNGSKVNGVLNHETTKPIKH